ncbi:PD-(D/E)XK motif protein [Streptomyces sp. NPDC053499]|uniref:PD-(D/E)XK motif protein n=1 Tax=Streptomyces sp. NPDC053499 TaxID=3365707 RepID=UPI0037CF5AA8
MRDEVERCWKDLAGRPASSARRLRTTPLPVATRRGPVLAALDHEGHRHLLVPIASNQRMRHDPDGAALTLRRRPLEDAETYQTYADLGCLRPDLDEVFTGLCGDVLTEMTDPQVGAETSAAGAMKALYRVLDRWRALFRGAHSPLGPGQLAGLFGELTVLVRLLRTDPSAHRLWRGPLGHRHDFAYGSEAIEAKTSVGDGSLRVRVHGLRQLEAPEHGRLHLVCFRLERSGTAPGATSVVDLAENALSLCDDEGALLSLLASAGYHPADAERYRSILFHLVEERWYPVDTGFPRLTGTDLAAAGVPIGVSDVEYTVDLTVEPPQPLPRTRLERILEDLLEGGDA